MAVEYLYGNDFDPPTDEENDDGQSRHTGHTVTFGVDGAVKEWGLWVPATNVPANLKWRLWDDDTDELLAEVDVAALAPTPGTWARGTSADFDTPGDVAVLATGTYALVKYTLGGRWSFSGSSTGTFDNGANITAVNGRYEGSSDGTSPPSGTFDFKPFVDVGFEADGGGGTEHTKSVGGTITPTSTIAKSVSRALVGSTTPSGAVSKGLSRALAGSTTPTGAITRAIGRTLGGAITLSSAITRAISRTLSGSISPTSALLKGLSRLLGSSITPTGSVSSAEAEPSVPTIWRAGPPEAKWHAGPPKAKWNVGRMPVDVFRATSTETIRSGPITAMSAGAAVDPTGFTVTVAFPATDTAPAAASSAWKAATWDTDATTTPATYRAQAAIGPSGVQELAPGTRFMFVKIAASGETPIIPSGPFKVVP